MNRHGLLYMTGQLSSASRSLGPASDLAGLLPSPARRPSWGE